MATNTQPAKAPPPGKHRASDECKLLLDAATQDLFRHNAFRITGLPVDATTRQIATHGDKIKLMEELGQGESAHTAAFALKPPPQLDQIREAVQKLNDPEKRLLDEFFWFWPQEFGKSQSDPALRALAKGDIDSALQVWTSREHEHVCGIVASHNLAVAYHLAALDWECYATKRQTDEEKQEEIVGYWRAAFTRWKRIKGDDRLWDQVVERVRQIDDARLTTGFARRMRASLPEALDKINGQLALAYAEAGMIDLARLHIHFIWESNPSLDNIQKTADLVLAPTVARLREQVQRTKRIADEDPAKAHEAAKALLAQATPFLSVFDLFFGENECSQKELFDEIATACVNCMVAYQRKTEDNTLFLAVLQRVLPLADSVEVRRRVEENIGIAKRNLDAQALLNRRHSFSALIQRNRAPLIIDTNGIRTGPISLATSEIEGVRWGIFTRVSGYGTKRSFSLCVATAKKALPVGWSKRDIIAATRSLFHKPGEIIPLTEMTDDRQQAVFENMIDAVIHHLGTRPIITRQVFKWC
jgi:hypothetical protein